MKYSKLMKQLKKQLRSVKRRVTLATLLFLVGIASYSGWVILSQGQSPTAVPVFAGEQMHEGSAPEGAGTPTDAAAKRTEQTLHTIATSSNSRQAYLKKNYVCGEETELLGTWTPSAILQYAKKHHEVELMLDEKGNVLFLEVVADLSPQCKENAFFGIDSYGNLNLYNGTPGTDNVIRTFFQLDVEQLKSSLPEANWKQLVAGIRISDVNEFNSVLSTFSDYRDSMVRKE
jgi:forespore regulator of the sigma-K checkpoint